MSGAPEGRVAFNIFEGLLMPGPTTEGLDDLANVVVPGVAESYSVSADCKTYTFKLRADAKWSDGADVTASDFVYSYERILTPGFGADYLAMLHIIEGAKAFSSKETEDFSTVGVKAVDAKTLEIKLLQPVPYFPELVAFYTFFPVPRQAIEKHGDSWTRPENIVSNGAYTLSDYKLQQRIVLKKNENYWGKADVAIPEAHLRIITDTNAVVNAYQAGELHWTGTGLPVAQLTSLITNPDYVKAPLIGTYYYRFNVKGDSPVKDLKVRQALSLAVDRDSLVKITLNGLHSVANGYTSSAIPGYESPTKLETNIAKAKKLLGEAGYPGGEGLSDLTLLYNTDENHKLVAEAIQAMWKNNLGVDVTLVNKEWATYQQDIDTLSYQIARAGWIGDYNDPMTFLEMFVSTNGNNDTGWVSPEYDTFISEAEVETDRAKRTKLLQDAETLLIEKGPIMPIYFYSTSYLASRFIEGFLPHNRDIHLIKYVRLLGANAK